MALCTLSTTTTTTTMGSTTLLVLRTRRQLTLRTKCKVPCTQRSCHRNVLGVIKAILEKVFLVVCPFCMRNEGAFTLYTKVGKWWKKFAPERLDEVY